MYSQLVRKKEKFQVDDYTKRIVMGVSKTSSKWGNGQLSLKGVERDVL